jgi:hypothetical protein
MDSRLSLAKWAEADSEVLHYSKIGQECLKAMAAVRPYLILTLRDDTIVHGWLEGLLQEHNATKELPIPTAWRGSIILQDDVREIELDFLEIESVRSGPAPIRLFDGASSRGRTSLFTCEEAN